MLLHGTFQHAVCEWRSEKGAVSPTLPLRMAHGVCVLWGWGAGAGRQCILYPACERLHIALAFVEPFTLGLTEAL